MIEAVYPSDVEYHHTSLEAKMIRWARAHEEINRVTLISSIAPPVENTKFHIVLDSTKGEFDVTYTMSIPLDKLMDAVINKLSLPTETAYPMRAKGVCFEVMVQINMIESFQLDKIFEMIGSSVMEDYVEQYVVYGPLRNIITRLPKETQEFFRMFFSVMLIDEVFQIRLPLILMGVMVMDASSMRYFISDEPPEKIAQTKVAVKKLHTHLENLVEELDTIDTRVTYRHTRIPVEDLDAPVE